MCLGGQATQTVVVIIDSDVAVVSAILAVVVVVFVVQLFVGKSQPLSPLDPTVGTMTGTSRFHSPLCTFHMSMYRLCWAKGTARSLTPGWFYVCPLCAVRCCVSLFVFDFDNKLYRLDEFKVYVRLAAGTILRRVS